MGTVADEVGRFIQDDVATRPVSIEPETDLLEEEIIDSLGIFAVIGFIEQRFGLKIDPADISVDNFRSVGAIEKLIKEGEAG